MRVRPLLVLHACLWACLGTLSARAATATTAPAPSASAPPAAAQPPELESDGDDEPEPSPEVDAASEELEAVRALEEAALAPETKPVVRLRQTLSRLGLASPLRARMEDAFEDAILREDTAYALGLITNLAEFDIGRVRDAYDIPVEMQPLVAQYIEFFQGTGRKWFRKWMGRSIRYIPMIQPLLAESGVPKDTVYLAMIESGFSVQAYSRARAAGMWQFISATGKRYGLKQDFWVDERRDFMKSTVAAAKYLKDLHHQLGHWYLAWAGYNAGGGRIQRMIDRHGTRDFWEICSAPGRGLAKETQHYVPKLIAAALVAKHPQAFGFDPAEFEALPPLEFETVELVDPADLEVIARAAKVPLDQVKDLNPELKRWCTPPASQSKPYVLRLPKGSATTFAENFPKIAPKERLTFVVYRVKRGDTLSQIARSYHSAPEPILQLNHLRSAKRLRVNSEIVIPVPRNKENSEVALSRQVERARRQGFVAGREEEEVPAGTPRSNATPGEVVTEQVDGKTKVTYTVQDGDTLWGISQRFQVSVDQLLGWNGLTRRSKLQLGARLVAWPKAGAATVATSQATTASNAPTAGVAANASANPPPPSVPAGERPKTHVLTEGETLWSVAQRYGISVEDLKRWNHIKRANALRAGQQLSLSEP